MEHRLTDSTQIILDTYAVSKSGEQSVKKVFLALKWKIVYSFLIKKFGIDFESPKTRLVLLVYAVKREILEKKSNNNFLRIYPSVPRDRLILKNNLKKCIYKSLRQDKMIDNPRITMQAPFLRFESLDVQNSRENNKNDIDLSTAFTSALLDNMIKMY